MSSPPRCPPLRRTSMPYLSDRRRAAVSISSELRTGWLNRATSLRLGVMSMQRGKSLRHTSSTKPCSISGCPLVEIMTGSYTMGTDVTADSPSRIPCKASRFGIIPILMARTGRSVSTEVIWRQMISVLHGCTVCTPRVFCAVRAVMTDAA